MEDRLRAYWDFGDLEATRGRLRRLLADEDAAGRGEVLTQLARVEALRGTFAAADELLDEASAVAGGTPIVDTRVALERGRLRRSSGEVDASLPLFVAAFETASAAGQWFLAADAAHMAALAAGSRDGFVEWTQRGLAVAEAHDTAGYWLGPLLNNLGWKLSEAGEHEAALDAFERALQAREQAGDGTTVAIARHAVGKALRALGRPADAAAQLEQAVAWAAAQDRPDGWFHEELAEDYAALGLDHEAREQAKLALPLLLDADPSFPGDEREQRLRELAGET